MFDRHTYAPVTNVKPADQVTHLQAAEIHARMRANLQAEQTRELLDTVPLADNKFTMSVVRHLDSGKFQTVYDVRLMLNGAIHDVRVEQPASEAFQPSLAMVRALHGELSARLVQAIQGGAS